MKNIRTLWLLFKISSLFLLLLITSTSTTDSMNIHAELLSYDYSDYQINQLGSITVWLRFKINLPIQSQSILSINISMNTPTRKIDLQELPEPFPNQKGIYYQIFSIPSKEFDENYLSQMISKSNFECTIYLEDNSKNILTVPCRVSINNVKREMFRTRNDFSINIQKCNYHFIQDENRYRFLSPELCKYIEKNPNSSLFAFELSGMATKESDYPIIGVIFKSESPNIFLFKHGIESRITTNIDNNDMISNGNKSIILKGIICTDEKNTVIKELKNAKLLALYSTEYAGNLDLSDAGDRIEGPKFALKIDINNIEVNQCESQ